MHPTTNLIGLRSVRGGRRGRSFQKGSAITREWPCIPNPAKAALAREGLMLRVGKVRKQPTQGKNEHQGYR